MRVQCTNLSAIAPPKVDLTAISFKVYTLASFKLNIHLLVVLLQQEEEDNIPKQSGNMTDAALLQYLFEFGEYYQSWRDDYPETKLIKVFEFTPGRKCMTTIIGDDHGGYKVYSKGAAEVLLELCTHIVGMTGELKEFSKEDIENLAKDLIEPWQQEGLRILCLATKNISSEGKLPYYSSLTLSVGVGCCTPHMSGCILIGQ